MHTPQLPPPTQGIPQTLKIEYVDGSVLKVPYFGYASTAAFLSLEEGISNYEIIPCTGE